MTTGSFAVITRLRHRRRMRVFFIGRGGGALSGKQGRFASGRTRSDHAAKFILATVRNIGSAKPVGGEECGMESLILPCPTGPTKLTLSAEPSS